MKSSYFRVVTFAVMLSMPAVYALPDKMNAKVRSIKKELQQSVFRDPKANLPSLISALTSGSSGQSDKVRLIHDWICDNIAYDTDMYFSGELDDQDYVSVLSKRKGICSGYVNVMNEMCRLAGVECTGVYGYSKGFGYSGNITPGQNPDHAWNAVKIGSSWRLVDATWDAGYVDYKTFVKHYSLDWYLTSPKNWLYSHLPLEDNWQLVPEKELKSIDQFVKEPYVAAKFFAYGLSFVNTKAHPMPSYNTALEKEGEFWFNASKTGVAFSAMVVPKDSAPQARNGAWTGRKGKTLIVNMDVPAIGEYKAIISAKYASEVCRPDQFEAGDYEGRILPQVEQLLESKKITQKECDLFEQSYYLVEENNRYYFAEDGFDTARNAAVMKVLKLFEERYSDNVLDFNLAATGDYTGYGADVVKYPTQYLSYGSATNTALMSPLMGVLAGGEEVKFEIASGDYSAFAVTDGGGTLTPMVKNAKTGIFELTYPVGDNSQKVVVYGNKDGTRYEGLWYYGVR